MVKTEKLWTQYRYRVTGHESREEAEAHVQSLRAQWGPGYGFYLVQPVEAAEDGTWKFTWTRGSSAD